MEILGKQCQLELVESTLYSSTSSATSSDHILNEWNRSICCLFFVSIDLLAYSIVGKCEV